MSSQSQEIVDRLKELKPLITAQYKVRGMSLFGSFVRGEQVESSDIDLLTEFDDKADLFDLIGLELYLEETFKRSVDIVPRQALRAELREAVLQQVVAI
jgi:predicted nucleotidyltransferase